MPYLFFLTKMLYLGIFGLEFEKNIVIFQISVLEFLLFGAKMKIFKSEIKNASFGYFWAGI